MTWDKEFRFVGRAGEAEIPVDGDGRSGPSPMSLLLMALASCTGSDVVDILRRGRQELRGLRVEARGERRQEPPHRYTRVRLLFRVEGPVERSKAERAVGLSFEKYCSVLHTLDGDLEVGWEVKLDETAREPGAT